jgi:hypothetical protein
MASTVAERIAAIEKECQGVWGTSGITSWERDRLTEWKVRTFLTEKQERVLQQIEVKAGLREADEACAQGTDV